MNQYKNNSELIQKKKDLICKSCNNSFKINKYHAGFSGLSFLYCDKCSNVVTWSNVLDRRYNDIISDSHWESDPHVRKLIEDKIKLCFCGGKFKFTNKLLCPNCKQPIADGILDTIYYIVLDKQLDGTKYNIWKKKDYWKKEPPDYNEQ
jgi:uncharacterized protein YbaR (Trm112 family)